MLVSGFNLNHYNETMHKLCSNRSEAASTLRIVRLMHNIVVLSDNVLFNSGAENGASVDGFCFD